MYSANNKFPTHPNHATILYTSIGGIAMVFVIPYFQARNVNADNVSA